ncbi:MAG: glucose-6-phosphate isomerase [Nitrospirae bacterium]|nr:glucose-6-phosphate isomerase [Nitrospirota bacterium]
MSPIQLKIENILPFLPLDEIQRLEPRVREIHERMEKGEGAGNDFLGWLHLPSRTPDALLAEMEKTARELREVTDLFIAVGIGGSYLGAKAAMTFLQPAFHNLLAPDRRKGPEVHFAGQNISSDYLGDLIDLIDGKRLALNVISKSGTTTEPAIAFRILKTQVEDRFGRAEARRRIVVTTDHAKGALKKLADQEGYKTFVIPDDVGGRYSVLTPVGLLPMAVSGIDIREIMAGARGMEEITADPAFDRNPAYRYAAIRHLLYRKGKAIEILSSFHPSLHDVLEWWKQLAGESEGKDRQGIFPASVEFTTDLHSMGQWIQEGSRDLFETFLTVRKSRREIRVPAWDRDDDGLNYLAGMTLEGVNEKAWQGTAAAHREGEVPNMTLELADRTPATLGALFYFFERAVAMSGYLAGINPFDQPGVEFYKKNMFRLLGKPGA